MNLISILSLVVFIIYLQAGVYVLWKNPGNRINRWFFYLSLCVAFWSLGFLLSYKAPTISQAIYWEKISIAGLILFPAFLIRFKTLLTNYPKSDRLKFIIYSLAFSLSISLLIFFIFFSHPLRQLVNLGEGYVYLDRSDLPLFRVINAFLILTFLATIILLILWRKNMIYGREKKQFPLVFYPLLLFMVLSILTDIIIPHFRPNVLTRMGHIFSALWLGGVAYGIISSRFFILTPAMAADKVIKEINQILFFCNLNSFVIRSNPYTEKILRIRSGRLSGRRINELFAEEKEIESYIKWTINSGYSGPVELNLRSFQGELIPVSISIAAVEDSMGDLQGVMIYGQDNREAIKLRNEIFMRQQVEKKLQSLSEMLEEKVRERTAELAGSYKELQIKMTERQRVEEQIKADIAEKDVLINEIHNRVKSNMDLIMALIDTHKNKKFGSRINKKFRELNRRVAAILLIHENLYLSLNYSEVDFSAFLRHIVREIAEFYNRQETVQIHLSLSEVFLDMDHAIPLGLVANELISNAFSHGFDSVYLRKNPDYNHGLWIYYGQKEGVVELIVRDNGRGLARDNDLFSGGTNGLPLVDVLVNDQIGGKMEISSSKGTMVKVKFPAPVIDTSINRFKKQ
jgi:two-component sensor histidine kinase